MPVLEFQSVVKRFGDFTAVDDLSFSVDKGRVFGFLGRNGAGKTTSMRMVLDILRPTSGEIRVFGEALSRHPHNAAWWTDLALLREGLGDPAGAMEALHEALREEPRYPAAAFHLGRLMRQRGEPAKALRWLERLRRESAALPAAASPYGRRILAWDGPAVDAEIALCRKDIIRP